MPAIYPVTTSRVSDLQLRQRLIGQFEFDRSELVRLQDQLSTGLRLTKVSDDAPAGLRAINLQRVLEQKDQSRVNLNTTRSFISATDNALSSVTELIANARANAVAAVDNTTSDIERRIISEEIDAAINQLVEIANQEFRGRYLFSGSTSDVKPFEFDGQHIVYQGNQRSLTSLVDLGYLFDTNITGDEVFGAISSRVQSSIDLNPTLREGIRLSDLRGGLGITPGSITITDSQSSTTVDLTSAETLGDVARLIEANPPQGRSLFASVTDTGLEIHISSGTGNFQILEANGGSTARELGLLTPSGVGGGPLIGTDLSPRLSGSTRLEDILGTRASASLSSTGENNDIRIIANSNGTASNNVQVRYTANTAVGDQASASYDSVNQILSIDISPGATQANTVVAAINATGQFTAELDFTTANTNDGRGTVELAATATTSGGSGTDLDRTSGIQITNGERSEVISFAKAETVEDLLNEINGRNVHVLARINASGTGIDLQSRISGANLSIGENGGTTAAQLGIRTLTRSTQLSELNFGTGVASEPGTDFLIRRRDGVPLHVDVSAANSVGDVIDAINNHLANTGNAVVARLAQFGNGIEVYDPNLGGSDSLSITHNGSFAAWDLGLIPPGADRATISAATSPAASISFGAPNNLNSAVQVTATSTGFDLNGVTIEFQNSLTGDLANATYDAVGRRLVVNLDSQQTTANTIVAAINGTGTFSASLDTSQDPSNNGSGLVGTTGVVGTTDGGTAERVLGADANPVETSGVFNSLIRLRDAIDVRDLGEIERTVQQLDIDFDRANFARGEVGARGQALDTIQLRLETEEVELRSTLSNEIDADLVETISELTARQANLEATLRLIGNTLQLTVLSFI